MQDSEIKEKMIRNFEKERGQFQVISNQKEWAKINPEDIYNLLKDCSGANTQVSKSILKSLALKKWTIAATAHEGGRDLNAPLHFTIRIKGQKAHHLNCKEFPGRGLHVYEIT